MTTHIPVLLHEILGVMKPEGTKRYLDCTFGGGGHSQALLDAGKEIQIVAIDCDPQAVERAELFKTKYKQRFHFYDMNFSKLNTLPEKEFHGILFDLGVSSFQLDEAERGFPFRLGGPTDMRLNPREGVSAADFLETASYEELVKAVRDYGEDEKWKLVVQAIMDARGSGKLANTAELSVIIRQAVQTKKYQRASIDPATKSFQGIRISINSELMSIEKALPAAFDRLCSGGVLAVISFHSLEDRIIKRYFRGLAGMPLHAGDSTPKQMRTIVAKQISNRPMTPSEEEISRNPRSRSAKLRVLIKN